MCWTRITLCLLIIGMVYQHLYYRQLKLRKNRGQVFWHIPIHLQLKFPLHFYANFLFLPELQSGYFYC